MRLPKLLVLLTFILALPIRAGETLTLAGYATNGPMDPLKLFLQKGTLPSSFTGVVTIKADGVPFKSVEASYKGGLPHGKVSYFNPMDGLLLGTADHELGKIHGKVAVYNKGRLVFSSTYVNGKNYGAQHTYHENGKLSGVVFVGEKNNHDESYPRASFNEDGMLSSLTCKPKNLSPEIDALCGLGGKLSEAKIYHSGKLQEVEHYLNGVKEGEQLQMHYQNGQLQRREVYKKGLVQFEEVFNYSSDKGKPRVTYRVINARGAGDNLQPVFSVNYLADGKINGISCSKKPYTDYDAKLCGHQGIRSVVEIYGTNDKEKIYLQSSQSYLNGMLDGETKEFPYHDSVNSVKLFSKGKLNGFTKAYHRGSDRLHSEQKYENDVLIYTISYDYSDHDHKLNRVSWQYSDEGDSGSIDFDSRGRLTYLECGKTPPYADAKRRCGFDGKPVVNQFYGADGKVSTEEVYLNGIAQGQKKSYSNGKIQYSENKVNGITERFHPNGKRAQLTFNTKDGREGVSIDYNEDGTLHYLSCGKTSFIPEDRTLCGFDGKISEVILYQHKKPFMKHHYLNGKFHGRQEQLLDNQVAAFTHYVNGEKDGLEQTNYRELPQQIAVQREWKKGQLVNETSFFQNGKKKEHKVYDAKDGGYLLTLFDDDGVAISHGRYLHQYPVGKHQVNNGFSKCIENYGEYGRLDGEQICVDKDSGEKSITTYKHGALKSQKIVSASGQVLEEAEYFEDGSRKVKTPRNPKAKGI